MSRLFDAVQKGTLADVKAAIAGGEKVNQRTWFGWTPLCAATFNQEKYKV